MLWDRKLNMELFLQKCDGKKLTCTIANLAKSYMHAKSGRSRDPNGCATRPRWKQWPYALPAIVIPSPQPPQHHARCRIASGNSFT